MNPWPSLWVGLSLALITAGPSRAQETQGVQPPNGALAPPEGLASNAYVGPYAAQELSLPGQPTIDGFSADYLHDITSGTDWMSYAERSGKSALTLPGRAGDGFSPVEQADLEAAWLASGFSVAPTASRSDFDMAGWYVKGTPEDGFTKETPWADDATANYRQGHVTDWEGTAAGQAWSCSGGTCAYTNSGTDGDLTDTILERGGLALIGSALLVVVVGGVVKRALV